MEKSKPPQLLPPCSRMRQAYLRAGGIPRSPAGIVTSGSNVTDFVLVRPAIVQHCSLERPLLAPKLPFSERKRNGRIPPNRDVDRCGRQRPLDVDFVEEPAVDWSPRVARGAIEFMRLFISSYSSRHSKNKTSTRGRRMLSTEVGASNPPAYRDGLRAGAAFTRSDRARLRRK
jgi:hypothetical protein